MRVAMGERSAVVIGAGGVGAPALLVLAGAGIGRLVVVDPDVVETSDLSRQPLFGEADLGASKATAAAGRLARLFPRLQVEPVVGRFDPASAAELAARGDLLLDACDDFATRFLANDTAVSLGKPLVHGGVLRSTFQLLTVVPGETGCLRCLFEAPPPPGAVPTGGEVGVLGALAGLAGTLLGAEAARLLSGAPGAYAGRLTTFESRGARCRAVPVPRRPGCPACGALGSGPRVADAPSATASP